ncbi:hypothetical protein IFR05_012800 [Cadophora sp. M221]|nr:hypothetical protein IFR05_012800 [Cadophora sp. M221]
MSRLDRVSSNPEYQQLSDQPRHYEELRSLQQECSESLEKKVTAIEDQLSLLDAIFEKVEHLTNVVELTNLTIRDQILMPMKSLKDDVHFIAEIQTCEENSMEKISDKIANIEVMIASSSIDTSDLNGKINITLAREGQILTIMGGVDEVTEAPNANVQELLQESAGRADNPRLILQGQITQSDLGLLSARPVRERISRLENTMDPILERVLVRGDVDMPRDQAQGNGLNLREEVSGSHVEEIDPAVKKSVNVWMDALWDVLNDFCLCLFWICTGSLWLLG